MFNFNRQPKQDPTYLALDIGTEFIKTTVFKIEEGEVKVIGYDRTPQKHNSMQGALIVNLINVVDVVDISIGQAMAMAESIVKQELALPNQAILGIAGELVKGVVIEVNVEREEPDSPILEKEVNSVIKEIKEQAFSNAKEQIALDTGINTDQIAEIETSVNSIYIDGVKVMNPIGLRGKELTYKVFSTFAPKIHLEAIKDVAKALKLGVHRVIVQPYALAMGMKNARTEKFSGIFIDIGGGTTDIALVINGALVGTKMFAFGGRVFTKRLEVDMKLDYNAAEQMKIDYSDQKLKASDAKQVKASLAKDLPVWVEGINIALSELGETGSFPPQIYLCGGGALLPEIISTLNSYPWLQVLPFTKFPKISYLMPNQIENFTDLTRTVTQAMDVTPIALARMQLDIVK